MMVDEQIGEVFDVNRKLTLLRRRRSSQSHRYDFYRITAGTLGIRKYRQQRQTKNDRHH